MIRKVVVVVCICLLLASFLKPASAKAKAPDPDYIPRVGVVQLQAQSADSDQVCLDIQTVDPKPKVEVNVALLTQRLFVPSVYSGDMCTELGPYSGANVFFSDDENLIPIVDYGNAAFQIGNLPVEELSYTPNVPIDPQEMYNLMHANMPENIKSLRLMSAWNIQLDEATLASISQLGDSPVDFPQVREGWRAHIMDEMIQEGYEFGFEIPVSSIVRQVPDKYRSVSNGMANARSIMDLCPGIETAMTSIPVDVQGFTILLSQGPFKNEITSWAFLDHDPVLQEICPQLDLYPWLLAGSAFQVLEQADQQEVDARVEKQTREWPVSLSFIPYPDPNADPIIHEGNADVIIWGTVYVVAVLIIGAVTLQPELWVFALVP